MISSTNLNNNDMRHNRYLLWPAFTILALAMACTNDEIATTASEPLAPPSSQAYTYKLRLNMAYPGSTTRGEVNYDYEWPDNSQIQFSFTKDLNKGTSTSGVATYNKEEGEWTAEAGQLPLNTSMLCAARYLKPAAGETPAFLTPTYTGKSKYVCSIENEKDSIITIDTLSLHPATWRMRFKGTEGTQLNFFSNDIVDDQDKKLSATLSLPVAGDGYTPYIYALFANPDGDNTINVETGGKTYHRTINGIEIKKGGSSVIDVPPGSDGKWIEETIPVSNTLYLSSTETLKQDSNGNKILELDADGKGKSVTVNANTSWKATVPKGLKCDPSNGMVSQEVVISATSENTEVKSKEFYVIFETTGDNKVSETLHVTQKGITPYINVEEKDIILRADGYYSYDNYYKLNVESNTTWTLSINYINGNGWLSCTDGSWRSIEVDSNNGKKEVEFVVTAEDNTSWDERRAEIKFSAEGVETKTVIVTQAAPYTRVANSTDRELVFEAGKNSKVEQKITIESNEHWTTSVQSTTDEINWCYASYNNGGNTLEIWCNPNNKYEERTATVSILVKRNSENYSYTAETITVRQKGKQFEPNIEEVSPNPLIFESNPTESKQITVKSNMNLEPSVTKGETWCHIESYTDQAITIKADKNDGNSNRDATILIVFKHDGEEKDRCEVAVKQNGTSNITVTPFGPDEDWDNK